jgi:hypothetical protein
VQIPARSYKNISGEIKRGERRMVYVITMTIVDVSDDQDVSNDDMKEFTTNRLAENDIITCGIEVESGVIVPEKKMMEITSSVARVLAHVCGIEEEEDINKVATGKEGTE